MDVKTFTKSIFEALNGEANDAKKAETLEDVMDAAFESARNSCLVLRFPTSLLPEHEHWSLGEPDRTSPAMRYERTHNRRRTMHCCECRPLRESTGSPSSTTSVEPPCDASLSSNAFFIELSTSSTFWTHWSTRQAFGSN